MFERYPIIGTWFALRKHDEGSYLKSNGILLKVINIDVGQTERNNSSQR